MDRITNLALVTAALAFAAPSGETNAETHVYEVVEKTFIANKTYVNPYVDVDLWVDLTGPDGMYKIPAFWDGENTFRVRLVATEPGKWTWSSGKKTGDNGLDGKRGSFTAVAWTEAEKKAGDRRPKRTGGGGKSALKMVLP